MIIRHPLFCLTALVLLGITSCLQQPQNNTDPDSIVIYPAPPAKTRIQYLTSFSSSVEFTGEQSALNEFLTGKEDPLPILKPYGISVNSSKIYICDPGISGLEILNLETNKFEYFVPRGRGQLQLPLNCDVDPDGTIYIADGNRKQIVIFSPELKYLDEFSLSGEAKPTDVFVDESFIWVASVDNHKIFKYNKSNHMYVGSFPDTDVNSVEYLYQPSNLCVSNNLIYVSDLGNCSVKVFDKEMNFINSFGSSGRGLGQFTRPKGISVDLTGNIYVVDAAFENVQIFNSNGELLLYFGGTYNGPGGMWLPADVTIDYNNFEYFEKFVDKNLKLEYLIYVTNQYGPDKVSVYGFVGLTG